MEASDRHSELAALVARYIDVWTAMNPHLAVNAGMHAFDGRTADWSEAAIARNLSQVTAISAELEQKLAESDLPATVDGSLPWSAPGAIRCVLLFGMPGSRWPMPAASTIAGESGGHT
jgi:hypothetical protein